MDPRIEERRAAVARRQGRRRLAGLLAVVLVLVLAVDGWLVLHSRLFSVRVVHVAGAVHTPAGQVLAAAGLADQPAELSLDTAAVAARVEGLPWVARATVTRDWPDGASIVVTERVPVAAVSGPGGWAEVDRTGRVLAWVTTPPAGLVHVGGQWAAGPAGTEVPALADAALEVAASLPPAFAGQVTEVVAQTTGQVDLALSSPVTVDLGTATQLRAKYEDVAAILAGATLHAGAVIDVSVPDSPVVTGG
jgi:cell division protein FtsQ